ncbi:hypothetical protein AAFF_G00087570 [Aldrovandia affinis]|uniref:Uncharacterized protein n=1 Tax=Aldrovandia affinis TaxID=143900 RepID=A0AAD7WC22_9TELE|nr:hypothetical protein AAFF_G00087570 [Aldrovandia affinis]
MRGDPKSHYNPRGGEAAAERGGGEEGLCSLRAGVRDGEQQTEVKQPRPVLQLSCRPALIGDWAQWSVKSQRPASPGPSHPSSGPPPGRPRPRRALTPLSAARPPS